MIFVFNFKFLVDLFTCHISILNLLIVAYFKIFIKLIFYLK